MTGARFQCTDGKELASNNAAQWGSYTAYWTKSGTNEAVCGAPTVVEPPVNGDPTAVNGFRLHCCAL